MTRRSVPPDPDDRQAPLPRAGWWLLLASLAIPLVDGMYAPEPEQFLNLLLFYAVFALELTVLQRLAAWLERRRSSSGVELALGFLVATVVQAGFHLLVAQRGAQQTDESPASLLLGIVMTSLWTVALWVLAFRYPATQRRAREAERLRSEAELAELRARLHPHFIGNSLNAIAGIVTADPARARELMADLGELFRDLAADTGAMRPLREELAWLRRYGALVEARFAGDLELAWTTDPDALEIEVPSLVLQPLLENAVVHASRTAEKRTITISAQRTDGGLVVRIDNPADGTGAPHEGAGLGLVRRRLEHWHPGARLELQRVGRHFHATVRLPVMPGSLEFPRHPARPVRHAATTPRVDAAARAPPDAR